MAWERYGTSAGPTSKYRVYVECRTVSPDASGAAVQYQWWIRVDSGDFRGTVVRTSWGQSASLGGPGWYAASGWRDYGRVAWGAAARLACSASYTGSTGRAYTSSLTCSYEPERPPIGPPAPPTSLRVAGRTDSSVQLAWASSSTVPNPWERLRIRRVDQPTTGDADAVVAEIAGTATSWTDADVRAGHGYVYGVEPVNSCAAGRAAWTDYVYMTPLAPPSASARRDSDSRNTVSWALPHDGVWQTHTLVQVERSVDGGGWAKVWESKANLPGSGYVRSWSDATTSADHSYRYRVRLGNPAGWSGYAATGTVANTPAPPSFARIARTGTDSVTASLSNPSRTATGTEVERSSDGGRTWSRIHSLSPKATSFSDAPGPGTYWYRARNTRGSLASAWATSQAAIPLIAPSAPTVQAPADSLVVTPGRAVEARWAHQSADWSEQSAAQVRASADGGATWQLVDVAGAASSAPLPGGWPVNSEVQWQVRTRGAHPDWGAWSPTRVLYVRQVPQLRFERPALGSPVEELPVEVELSYDDPSGELRALRLEALQAGRVAWSRELGAALSCAIPPSELVPANGGELTLRAVASSTSSLQASAEVTCPVDYLAPAKPSLEVSLDEEAGCVALRVVAGAWEGPAETSAMSLWRVAGGGRELLLDRVSPGTSCVDWMAPVNTPYSYEVVAESAMGTASSDSFPGSFPSERAYFLYAWDGARYETARARWSPEASVSAARPGRELVWYAGSSAPTCYDDGSERREHAFSAALMTEGQARAFAELSREPWCVYKGLRGEVARVAHEISLTPETPRAGCWGRVSVRMTEIDGGAL